MGKQYQITIEPNGLYVKFQGTVKVEHILEAHSAYFKHPKLKELSYGIWDYSEADSSDFEEESLYRIIASDLKTSVELKSQKMAIIITDPRAQELSRIYIKGLLACHNRWKIELFATEAEARDWINQ